MILVDEKTTMCAAEGISRRVLVVSLATVLGGILSAVPERLSVEAAKEKKRRKKEKSGKKHQKPSGSGDEVVRVAKKYKNAKYVWGGESPRGFDCSGFTMFVYQEATGMEIGRTVPEQWKQGRSVSQGELKPGDIVFFKNTFERGLSHNGISLGGNKFIHAENEETDVVISDLSSDYYSDHYAGARRLL